MARTLEQILHHKLKKQFQKALTDFNMLSDDDRVLVGVSGGKDSLCLLELPAERSKIIKPHFQVEALHIRMSNIHYETDAEYLKHFSQQLGVPMHIETINFEMREGNNKPACFLCSWHRRKKLFEYAKEHKFNKIALGHHQDDIIHTTLLNEFFQGSFATMPAVLKFKHIPITIIRPLCMEKEIDIVQYASLRSYMPQIKSCPFEKDSNREQMRNIFNKIEKINPEARYSMWHALMKEGKLKETSLQESLV